MPISWLPAGEGACRRPAATSRPVGHKVQGSGRRGAGRTRNQQKTRTATQEEEEEEDEERGRSGDEAQLTLGGAAGPRGRARGTVRLASTFGASSPPESKDDDEGHPAGHRRCCIHAQHNGEPRHPSARPSDRLSVLWSWEELWHQSCPSAWPCGDGAEEGGGGRVLAVRSGEPRRRVSAEPASVGRQVRAVLRWFLPGGAQCAEPTAGEPDHVSLLGWREMTSQGINRTLFK